MKWPPGWGTIPQPPESESGALPIVLPGRKVYLGIKAVGSWPDATSTAAWEGNIMAAKWAYLVDVFNPNQSSQSPEVCRAIVDANRCHSDCPVAAKAQLELTMLGTVSGGGWELIGITPLCGERLCDRVAFVFKRAA